MLTQEEVDVFLEILKQIKSAGELLSFPGPGEYKSLNLISEDSKHEFLVDINRKGYLNDAKKYTYQARYRKDIILLRLDIDGPEHTNPDGTVLPGRHLHVYKEGCDDRWAIEVPQEIINPDDMYQTLIDFLKYFKTTNADMLKMQTVM